MDEWVGTPRESVDQDVRGAEDSCEKRSWHRCEVNSGREGTTKGAKLPSTTMYVCIFENAHTHTHASSDGCREFFDHCPFRQLGTTHIGHLLSTPGSYFAIHRTRLFPVHSAHSRSPSPGPSSWIRCDTNSRVLRPRLTIHDLLLTATIYVCEGSSWYDGYPKSKCESGRILVWRIRSACSKERCDGQT